MSEHIDLEHAFPGLVKLLHQLREDDGHFAKLYVQYMVIESELARIEKEVETPADDYVEGLKKKRLALKDEMSEMLHQAAA